MTNHLAHSPTIKKSSLIVDRWILISKQLKPRMEALSAHELAEAETVSHVEALAAAANTMLPVSHEARELLWAMERDYKRR
jgi:hypothetical protein